MVNKQKITLSTAIIFICLIFALTDPIDILMPTEVQNMLLVATILVYAIFAGLIYKEKPADEREEFLLKRSSRTAFLVGITVLLTAIVFQTLNKNLDNWLIVSLGSMVATKVIVHYLSSKDS